ncbi:hypothetical protein PYW07_007379 [Mythimna separata]|uniref:Uncharacterized protein n=1 Tax=Mythimna separata TaxID=271217 RepID=A0AAD8DZW9_MYTSE|nr:hypothetical protein PYW07_007379 [Mythimna separata]
MGKKTAIRNLQVLKEIFDSDDELPTEYDELPLVPAYLMDNRFDHNYGENENKDEEKTEDRQNTETERVENNDHTATWSLEERDKGVSYRISIYLFICLFLFIFIYFLYSTI